VIPTIITQIASGVKEIKLGDVSPTRDFNYVTDTCNGLISIAESDKTVGETINIGSNSEISIGETLNLIKKLMNSEVDFVLEQKRIRPVKSEVSRLWCDNTKIKTLTNFSSTVSLEQGLKKTINWFSEDSNLKHYKANIYNI